VRKIAIDTEVLCELATVRGNAPSPFWLDCQELARAHPGTLWVPLPAQKEFVAGTPTVERERRREFLDRFADRIIWPGDRSVEIIDQIVRVIGPLYRPEHGHKQRIKWDVAIVACAVEAGYDLCSRDGFLRRAYEAVKPPGGRVGPPDEFLPPQRALPGVE